MDRVLVLNAVGLTPKLLHSGFMPLTAAYAASCAGEQSILPDLPAVTCTAQASMLCGCPPSDHGAVGNGWYFRDLSEVWLWRQSAHLLQRRTILQRWCQACPESTTAQIFWWWNLPSTATYSVTPRPTYWADGRKEADIHSNPPELRDRLRERLGDFPLFSFWGPGAGIASTRWIVDATLDVLAEEKPGLTLSYLPHLDYDLQRFGPESPEALRAAAELDTEIGRLIDAAEADGIHLIVLSEYGIESVNEPVFLNRALRLAGLLEVHPAKNGALLDAGNSRAFAVCDHQCAHIYVQNDRDIHLVREILEMLPGVERVYSRDELRTIGLEHGRSGALFAVAAEGAWFAYPYWVGDDVEPDFARTVDIHQKPGYDPCELFLDPDKRFLKPRLALKLLAKKMGLRTLFNPIPLDANIVCGSHGRLPSTPETGPLWIGPVDLRPHANDVIRARDVFGGLL